MKIFFSSRKNKESFFMTCQYYTNINKQLQGLLLAVAVLLFGFLVAQYFITKQKPATCLLFSFDDVWRDQPAAFFFCRRLWVKQDASPEKAMIHILNTRINK